MRSAVAGIVDRGGGLRVVVTERWRMQFHAGEGEKLYIVPGLEVDEPVDRGNVPYLIDRVKTYVHSQGGLR